MKSITPPYIYITFQKPFGAESVRIIAEFKIVNINTR